MKLCSTIPEQVSLYGAFFNLGCFVLYFLLMEKYIFYICICDVMST